MICTVIYVRMPSCMFPFMVELLVPPACPSTLMSSKKEVLRQLSRLINHSFNQFIDPAINLWIDRLGIIAPDWLNDIPVSYSHHPGWCAWVRIRRSQDSRTTRGRSYSAVFFTKRLYYRCTCMTMYHNGAVEGSDPISLPTWYINGARKAK